MIASLILIVRSMWTEYGWIWSDIFKCYRKSDRRIVPRRYRFQTLQIECVTARIRVEVNSGGKEFETPRQSPEHGAIISVRSQAQR